MPQMGPLFWLILMLWFLTCYFLVLVSLYFNFSGSLDLTHYINPKFLVEF